MAMFKIDNKLRDLGLRVYNNKMLVEKIDGEEVEVDKKDFADICKKTWGNGVPTTDNLERFNALIIETADKIAEPKIEKVLNLLAQYKKVGINSTVMYELPKTVKPKLVVAANGSGIDLVRLGGEKTKRLAQPKVFGFGCYYEITDFLGDPERAFREAVESVANAKIEKFFEIMFECMKASVKNAEIPANNVKEGSSLSLADFQKVENTIIRLGGGRPLFVADSSLINHFADQIPTSQTALLTDDVRDMLREDLVPSKISKSIALTLPNEWIDDKNSKVKFDCQRGFLFPSNIKGKPFGITEFGEKRTYSELDWETEQVKLNIKFSADITLLNGRYLGVITDNSVTV